MHVTQLRNTLASSRLLAAALGLAAATTVAAAAAAASPPAGPPEATIPFAAHDGIEDWEADGSKGLWIKARGRHWYYARFFAPCSGLQFRNGLQFKFGPGGELDRFGEIYTRDTGRCAFTSLVASGGPPPKPKKAAPAAPATPAPTN
jgi:Family of unknown function (DUF6491)